MSAGGAPATPIYCMVIVSLLHMITASGSVSLMAALRSTVEPERAEDEEEEEERGRTP